MTTAFRKSISLIIGIIFSLNLVFGQYQTKTIAISRSITTLHSSESSYLKYGTKQGEVGLYDGIVLDRRQKFNGSISEMKTIDGILYYLTSKGLYSLAEGKAKLLSPNNLHILDVSSDLSMLVTTSGIYDKSGNDYIPNREEFYDINEVANGKFLEVGDQLYLWIDHKIYIKDKSWKEHILHPQSQMSAIVNGDRLIISDAKGIVSFLNSGTIDTLYQSDSIGLTKLYSLSNNQLLYCAENEVGVFNIRNRQLSNIREINTELIHAATLDAWENIWIAAGSYLYQVIDTKNQKTLDPPVLSIRSVKVNGSTQEINQPITLEKGNNYVEIAFGGIHLSHPQDLVYQTKLSISNNLSSGIQNINDWTQPSTSKEADYRNLPAGKYKFQVRATVDDNYHTYSKIVDIRVNDNSVQYFWLAGLLGASGILLTALFFNTRYNRLKEKSDLERKQLLQENKMLSLQQKALQLQMNPHFVFNALNSIQGLIAKEDNKNARKYLQQFSSVMRSVLNQSRQEKISLDDEIIYLKSYLSLEQMANNDSFDFEIHLNPNLEDGLDIPTMIIQPFIENAIIHGVKGLRNRRGIIKLSFAIEGLKLKCSIEDNGVGRESAAKNRVSSHKSVALDVVNERLKSKGDRNNPVKYIDLKDTNGSALGTLVEVLLPIM